MAYSYDIWYMSVYIVYVWLYNNSYYAIYSCIYV